MALVKGICPNCGKSIEVEENDFNVVCTYCGVPFFPREAIEAYNKQISELMNNLNVDTLNVNADNISNYATLGFQALKDNNHEKCGFYADDILKRKPDSPEGLLFKAFFVSNNYSKEEGIRYYVLAYKNTEDDKLKELIIETFKNEFEDYSLDNFVYFFNEVVSIKAIDDVSFIKYALTFVSSSEDGESIISDLHIDKSIIYKYIPMDSLNNSVIENMDIMYNEQVLILCEGEEVKVFVDLEIVEPEVEKFAHKKGQDERTYYFYVGSNRMVAIKLSKTNEELELIIERVNLSILEAKSGCYIATCVYNSYNHPKVNVLRRFRDECLKSSFFGRLFIKLYYFVSPILVKLFGETKWFKKVNKLWLDAFVKSLREKGFNDSTYRDVK